MKRIFYFSICVVVISALVVSLITTSKNVKPQKVTAISSEEMLQQYIKRKVERRAKGYAKPDKPDKYLLYKKELRSNGGQTEYPTNYKLGELKSAITNKSSLKSTTEALPWVWRGPGNVGGRTRSIIIDPDDTQRKTWFAGSVSGGIWKTIDSGDTWELISPEFPNLATVTLAIAPSNSNVIYVGTGEGYKNIDAVQGDGIFKSIDKGQTWSQISSTANKTGFHYVNSIAVSSTNENTIWAATNSGVVKSTDGGDSWYFHGAEYDWYQRLIIHPTNDDVLWVTRNDKGIYKTENGGEKWFLVHEITNAGRIEITVSKNNPDVLYAIDEESNFYYSVDGGVEWAKGVESGSSTDFLGGQGWYNSIMAVNPTDDDKGFIGGVDFFNFTLGSEKAGTGDKAFEITNGISSFIELSYFGGDQLNGGIKFYSENNEVDQEIEIQFGSGRTQKAHLFEHKDAGGIFNGDIANDIDSILFSSFVDVPFKVVNITTGDQLNASFIDKNGNNIFDLYDDAYEVIIVHDEIYNGTAQSSNIVNNNANYKMMASLNPQEAEGTTWDGSGLPTSSLKFNCYTLKDRNLSASKLTAWNVSKSASNYSHADHHHITILEDVGSPFTVIVGNDGGINYSSNGGASWTEKSDGYVTSQFYGLTRHPKEYKYFGGLQDNGSQLSLANPDEMSNWSEKIGGDGFDVVWHSRNPDCIIGSIYYNRLSKSTDGGAEWSSLDDFLGDSGDSDLAPFLTKIASCIADPDLLFTASKSGIWRSNNFGSSWTNVNMGSDWGYASNSSPKIAISEANPDIVWAGVRMNQDSRYTTGNVYVSTDGGNTFNTVPQPRDMGAVSNIAAHPTDPNTAYVLFSFADYPKVFRTTDLGQNWEDISGFGLGGSSTSSNGFPDVAVNTLLVMPFNTNEIWVGTEIGLFISTNNGVSWTIAEGIPAVSIWDIKIIGDEVILGTHGLGVWTVKRTELTNEIENPYIESAGVNPKGDFALKTLLEANLDSIEIYTETGLFKTNYNLTAGTIYNVLDKEEVTPQRVRMIGYLSGIPYSSNAVSFDLKTVNDPVESYTNDFTVNKDDFSGTGFAITSGIFSNDAIQTSHPYEQNTDYTYTLKYPIKVSSDSELAFIKYHDIAFLETGEVGSNYPEQDFYDYVVVEGSKDGVNWLALSPGYDFSYNSEWALGGKTYESTPDLDDFIDHHINLYDTFNANDTILVRFKIHSDPYRTGWGWIIDNIRIQDSTSSIIGNKSNLNLSVYPNPIKNGMLNLRLENNYIGSFDIYVYDTAGKLVHKKSYFKGTETHKQRINISNISSGSYLLKVKQGNKKESIKLRIIK